jgi:hypothetical protein
MVISLDHLTIPWSPYFPMQRGFNQRNIFPSFPQNRTTIRFSTGFETSSQESHILVATNYWKITHLLKPMHSYSIIGITYKF